MPADVKTPEFSLLGGPLHRMACRLGLTRAPANSTGVGLALGLITWGVLMALSFVQWLLDGTAAAHFPTIGAHVRLLIAIPLLFVTEAWVDPRTTAFVRETERSGLIPQSELPDLSREIRRVRRLNEFWLVEAGLLVAAFGMELLNAHFSMLETKAWAMAPAGAGAELTLAGSWYWMFCLPLFRFLLLRWLWRLGVWTFFLWRLSRLEIRLIPIHPDYTAGLGNLELVHIHFAPLIAAISAVLAASYAEDVSAGKLAFEAIFPQVVLILLVDMALFTGPLFIFTPKLWRCRLKGLSDYMVFSERYVRKFDRKWLRGGAGSGDELLGTADIQSLADLSNSIEIVRNMRWVPVSYGLLVSFAAAAILPMLPLLLLKYPIDELAQRILQMLVGI